MKRTCFNLLNVLWICEERSLNIQICIFHIGFDQNLYEIGEVLVILKGAYINGIDIIYLKNIKVKNFRGNILVDIIFINKLN